MCSKDEASTKNERLTSYTTAAEPRCLRGSAVLWTDSEDKVMTPFVMKSSQRALLAERQAQFRALRRSRRAARAAG